jgi:hypothetical protein
MSSVLLSHKPGRFDSSAQSKGQKLDGAYARLPDNDESSNQPKPNLRNHKPFPVDQFVHQGIDYAEAGVQQPGPDQWRDEAPKQDWSAWKHRQ